MSHEENPKKKLPSEVVRKLAQGGEPNGAPHNETPFQEEKLTPGGKTTGALNNETTSNSEKKE
jgi:hypothetical protein